MQRFPLLRKRRYTWENRKQHHRCGLNHRIFQQTSTDVINLRDRCPVIIMASESCDPPYYRVVDGSLEMFYLSYSEAVDYCRQSGYMTQK